MAWTEAQMYIINKGIPRYCFITLGVTLTPITLPGSGATIDIVIVDRVAVVGIVDRVTVVMLFLFMALMVALSKVAVYRLLLWDQHMKHYSHNSVINQ